MDSNGDATPPTNCNARTPPESLAFEQGRRAGVRGCWISVGLVPVLMMTGCLIAGFYGIFHNQISYTVSEELFRLSLFPRFHVDPDSGRWGAAAVGFSSTWWMGVLLGIPIVVLGATFSRAHHQITHTLIAFALVAATALAVGVGALVVVSFVNTTPPMASSFGQVYDDPIALYRAGKMHDFSYAGGALGALVGSVYLLTMRLLSVGRASSEV